MNAAGAAARGLLAAAPLRVAAVLALVVLAAACGNDAGEESAAAAPPGPPPIPNVTITIENLQYPGTPPITPDAQITVVNNDLVMHSITSKRPGLFDHDIAPGQTVIFRAPGEIGSHPFYCKYHGLMDGWLSVRQ
ncbi:hypothetical protein [Nocardia xishanensis]|uniref:hypothetical protein n=1 Tax=Nocardia xishanensis TaxID=238964 RepID=UPI000830F1AD|nr:hypothetical protein [Nocardia xishanensis]